MDQPRVEENTDASGHTRQGLDDKATEHSQQASRIYILVFFWVVIIAAIPFWWNVTSIQRLSIPEARVNTLEGRKVSPRCSHRCNQALTISQS